ncbi:NAD(P)H-dependent glycerol-3-phosphate dehydrogenase [Spongiibacter taiwanensis]|uniref:NAD(P)H-dependent glycerol-3-phosphate dehydrogenase n=1 Tax=Spongiibacter taiwanensis TaxID=1748242 RepID=UPI002034CB0C|nr:NAD(P)H-dependent glycerol-3-phosphate dehydrogenase [Spongiibacter taiwanensis]USA43278.1 NAD(P)H-dependent glycerol-3-phosphate dehydrogenase [Spongiibacter taiwanensis]
MADQKYRVAIVGGGSFGTAISNIVADNGHDVRLWMRRQEAVDEVNQRHENSDYLPGIALNSALRASADLAEAVAGCQVVFMSVPSKPCRSVAKQLAEVIEPGAIVVSTTKGIELESNKLMSQVLEEELPGHPIGVMSGPNLAKELASRMITGTVIASSDPSVSKAVQSLLQCGYFRVYAGSDMYGVELAGALKNVYAITAGMAASMDCGHNTISMLITRALAEMSRYAVHKGADPMTFLGLAGVGDLFVTCTSPLSRNYRVGYELGKGKTIEDAVASLGQVAEGINTLKLMKEQSDQLGIYMPLVNGLYDIVYNGRTVDEVIGGMMWSEQNRDVEFATR